MAGSVKLLTSAGGGVVLDTATTTATDVTVKVPVTGVNNGTLVCSDSSGNVGIGTSSPGVKLDVQAATSSILNTSTTGTNYVRFNQTNSGGLLSLGIDNSAGSGIFGVGAYAAGLWYSGNYPLVFATNNTERMRIDSSGNLLVGCTGVPDGTSGGSAFYVQSVGRRTLRVATTTTSGAGLAEFVNPNGVVGTISVSGSTTTYGTSSDYRLKENIQPMTNALDKIAQLNPVTYTWKESGIDGQGFIAHELQAVVPDCVTGEKDAVDAEGNPVYQGIDTSFLVATLTKAIQELSAKNDALEARIATLEAK